MTSSGRALCLKIQARGDWRENDTPIRTPIFVDRYGNEWRPVENENLKNG